MSEISKKINDAVFLAVSSHEIEGFEKAFQLSSAITTIKELLNKEYMKPIMSLQKTKIGFNSDKIYDEETVKICLIEAISYGLQPIGNEFNIIGGTCYVTKEGFQKLLSKIDGLNYDFTFKNVKIDNDKTSASCIVLIEWELNGVKSTKEITFLIKSNQYAGNDAIIGKATRKASAWLFNKIKNINIGDGDVMDVTYTEVKEQIEDPVKTRLIKAIKGAETKEKLEDLKIHAKKYDLLDLYLEKFNTLQNEF